MPETQLVRHEPQQQQKFADFAAVRGLLYRQRWLVAGVIVIALTVGLVLTLLATPMYEARSSVRIEPYGSFIVEGQNLDQGVAPNQVWDLMSTQIGVIESRAMARTVVVDLNLAEREDFLGPEVDENRPANISDEAWLQVKQDMATARLHGSVSAAIPHTNWIIEIAYRSESPVIAAELANAYALAFASSGARASLENNEYAQEYLSEQIQLTRERLQKAEQAANAYARANGIIIQPSEDGEEGNLTTLTSANLGSINQRVSAARAARIEAEQRWRSIQNLPPQQLSEVQGSSLLQSLIAERSSIQNELTDQGQRLLPQHPTIVSLQEQLNQIDSQIAQRSSDIKLTARTQYVIARNQEAALQQELNSATGETLEEQETQVQYGVLEREARALRDQLASLLNRFNEISTAANVDTGTVNMLDAAVVPASPYSPSLLRNLAAALVLGAGLAGMLALLRETADDMLRSFEQIEQKVGLRVLGHTPYVEEHEFGGAGADRFSPLVEAYGSIRSTIDFLLPRERNVIQFTSTQAGEGKSTTAVILSELFAGHGRKTLLIDGDLRRPALAKMLDVERSKVGLVEVLQGQAELQSAVIKGYHENLDILPIGAIPSNPTEIFASQQLREFIEKSRREYSLVIFDSSPMLGLADAAMLSNLVDGTIFVAEANRVQFRQLRTAVKRLAETGGKPLGAIVTKFRSLEAGQSYDYQYAYYQYGDRT